MDKPLGAFRLKIVSDGTRSGTHVVNPATGERLPNVVRIEWNSEGSHLWSTATITVRNVAIEIELPSKLMVDEWGQYVEALGNGD